MNNAPHYALAWISIAILSACGKSEVTAPKPAAEMQSRPTETARSETTPREIRLGEEIVDPDANEPLTSDEDTVAIADAQPTDALVLADLTGEVTFQATDTSSLRATAAQAALADTIARHNREIRQQTSSEVSEPATADAAAPPVALATLTSDSQVSKPAPPVAPIEEKKILAEPQGQWASTAIASSTYAQTPGDKAGYSAWQATGKPNVPRYADHPAAWTTKSGDSPVPEWLEVGFAKPVHATSIRIRQTAAPGAIGKIELLDTDGAAHEIWSGTDDTPYQKDVIGWLVKDFPKTAFAVKGARITLLTARVWGWNEIDAVQLVSEP